ncbi:MAG: 30S ribosomal protein S6 [Rickettsiales bacterium]|jgi:small subunit ribosomal protein S6|nr:30S ribosomal protein S6 [Rickettsiales bacterium]
MPLYETIFITRQEVSLNDVEKFTANFSKILTDNGGTIVKIEQWGLRDLAYPIKKSNKAYYTMLAIDSPYGAVKEMEAKLALSEDILRHVTVKVEKISKNPSAPIARPSSNEDAVVEDAKVDKGE